MGTKKHKRPDRIIRIPKELHAVLKAFCFQYDIESVDELTIDILSNVVLKHHKNIMDNLPAQRDLISEVVGSQFNTVRGGV